MLDFLSKLDSLERRIERAVNPWNPRARAKNLRRTEEAAARRLAERERAREAAAAAAAQGRHAPLFPEYHDRPVEFAVEVLGLRLCKAQRDILHAIARGTRVAIRSGQKTGKSTAFVAAALWWAATRRRARVLFTGPGNAQVKDILWKELRRVVYDDKNLRPDGAIVADVLGVEPSLLPHTGMQWPDGREIVGFVRKSPTATQGFSGPEVLIIIDEASGVPDDIFAAHEGNTAAEGRILAASNPTSNVGWFYEAFHTQLEFWDTHHFSSEDTPNITGKEPAIEGLAGPTWLKLQREKYGVNHPEYLVRVKGEFAGTASNTVVGLALCDKASRRYRDNVGKAWRKKHSVSDDIPDTDLPELRAALEDLETVAELSRDLDGPLELGLDSARFGDDNSCITTRRGRRVFPLQSFHGADGNEQAARVLEVVRMCRRPDEVPVVKIDCTGGYGASASDILRAHHADEVVVVEVNSSEAADDEIYANRRAQLHFGFAQFLEEGGELPPDTKLRVELLAPTYSFDNRRRYLVEAKDKIKKRLKRSPDRADSAALSVLKAAPETFEVEEEYDDYLPKLRI